MVNFILTATEFTNLKHKIRAKENKNMNRYPKCFPPDFEETILPKGAKTENKHVYRLIKYGTIDRDSFISSYEEIQRGLKPPPKRALDLNDPGTYSTSCHMEYADAEYLSNIFMRHCPKTFIAEGETDISCGPCQLTSERENREDSHIDWWIYDKAEPQRFFKEVEQNEK